MAVGRGAGWEQHVTPGNTVLARAVVTKDPRLGSLHDRIYFLTQFPRPEVQDLGVGKIMLHEI